MAAMAHLGVGLAAKRVAPRTPTWALVVAAWGIDLVWGAFFFAGLERFPAPGITASAPYSHGLFMALVWSALAAGFAFLLTRDRRIAISIGLIVLSHWVVDFISKPMLAAFPTDAGLPLLFGGSPSVGLGLYRTQLGQNLGEYGTLGAGAAVYALTLWGSRREKRAARIAAAREGM